MTGDGDVADAGLQFERTTLAHWRTTLAATVACLLIIRQSDAGAERVFAVVAALGALLTIAGVGVQRRVAFHHRDATVRPAAVAAIVVALVGLQIVALVVVL